MNKGKIFLVGFGPGAEEHMSLRARQAIAESDVVIGYSTYIKLVKELLDGKEVIRKGMTEELDRSYEAYEQAKQGKTVALISSGDIGVYGMAGPTYEVLLQSGWTPQSDVAVEVVPGTTALSACASLVGAPLTHDFCSISLSDLLTPWPVIARRLEAAARSDFVVALYNPKSGRRRQQIVEAQKILLRHRRPDTPVAIVKSGYRPLQNIQMVTLEEMADCDIGMLTTVLVGNSSTYLQEGLMITPRGYANKYDAITGDVKAGEKKGRSLSMGLEGWKDCVRAYMRQNESQPLGEVARHFDAPLGEVLAAIADAEAEDKAGAYDAVPAPAPAAAVEAARAWGTLWAVVGSEHGVLSKVRIGAEEIVCREGQIQVEKADAQLQFDLSRIRRAWLVRSTAGLRAMYFIDAAGESPLSFESGSQGDSSTAEAEQLSERSWGEWV